MDGDFNITLRWVIQTFARFNGEAFPRDRLMLRSERTPQKIFRNLPILGDPWMAPAFRLPASFARTADGRPSWTSFRAGASP